MPQTEVRRTRRTMNWVIVLIVLIAVLQVAGMLLVFTVGYHGRVTLNDRLRADCRSRVTERAHRRDESLAEWRASTIVSSDPGLPTRTRDARRAEARAHLASVLASEALLPRSLRRTRRGRELPEFTCGTAFPRPSGSLLGLVSAPPIW